MNSSTKDKFLAKNTVGTGIKELFLSKYYFFLENMINYKL